MLQGIQIWYLYVINGLVYPRLTFKHVNIRCLVFGQGLGTLIRASCRSLVYNQIPDTWVAIDALTAT